jgi:hypothetical protein
MTGKVLTKLIDKSNHFISKAQVRSLIRGNLKVSSDMVFRHALKEDFSNYRSVINCPLASKRTIMLLSGCLLARAWAALIATSLLPF